MLTGEWEHILSDRGKITRGWKQYTEELCKRVSWMADYFEEEMPWVFSQAHHGHMLFEHLTCFTFFQWVGNIENSSTNIKAHLWGPSDGTLSSPHRSSCISSRTLVFLFSVLGGNEGLNIDCAIFIAWVYLDTCRKVVVLQLKDCLWVSVCKAMALVILSLGLCSVSLGVLKDSVCRQH